MSDPIAAIATAVEAEERALDGIVADLGDRGWATPTPAAGWTVKDQIGHLALSEEWAALAIEDAAAFGRFLEEILAEPAAFGPEHDRRIRALDGPATLAWWRERRGATLAAARALPDGARIPWFGPPMGTRAFLTARLMETWAHGQDARDALGAPPSQSQRLRDIAHLGVITRGFAYANRRREMPAGEVRVELRGPDGETWTWGPDDAADRVSGTALDFCLVATQRRNVADTALEVEGAAVGDWMHVIQAFAGRPTDPPPPTSPDV